ncbi:phosphatase PAP2 family protein [Amycolatopsis sp. PS_44_ISF1]|uniref:phosphatase PAP2 family protein n=1 Tax=Amycolatopsis sp. PS_44_ISF1 TaxID=2974917 RepID=UPI0028E04284|nr:phosphatase PAP2 family protein [Amycolatopsis sp. PS_44_ISF1]MDT8909838.1 phosphatase PAP2 family protein [Amycolatopsis sp. PS_44_ISF1]
MTAPVLPASVRPPSLVLAGLGLVVLVGLGVRFAGHSAPSAFDAGLLPGPDGLPDPWWYLATAIDFCGEPVGSVLLVALFVGGALLAGRRRTAVLTVVGSGVTVALTSLAKPLTGRTIHGSFLSYPSGHTAFATALALVGALVLVDRLRLGRPAGVALLLGSASVAGFLMAWAEVGLGAHYPSDTIGGFATALAVVPTAAWAVDRVAARRQVVSSE